MKTRRFLFSFFAALGAAVLVHGQAAQPGAKSPADLAAEDFFKLRDNRSAKLDEARFDKLIATGVAFLVANPEHASAPAVAFALGTFGGTIADPKLRAFRISYSGKLNSAIIDFRYKADLSPAAQTACAALDAAARDDDVRTEFNRDNLRTLREKIDALTPLPGSGRFLVECESSYADLLSRGVNEAAGERHLKKLVEHPDRGVATMARDNLNLMEVRRAPYQLKFTALDGKEFDVAKWRGKVVALMFWSVENEVSLKHLAAVGAVHAAHRSRGFEVVGVSLDKAEDREKVLKFVADKKLTWPVHFDGAGEKNEWVAKLNVRTTPRLVIFDQKGMLLAASARTDMLDGAVRNLLGIKEEAAMEEPPAGGGRGKRR